MVKKKQSQETETAIVVDEDEIAATSEDDQTFKDLSDKLAEYAIFSNQVMDSSQEISDQFDLGDVENILIEGKESKALCTKIQGSKISIFMERNANHAEILKQISP